MRSLATLVVGLCLIAGCQPDTGRREVTGTVTLGGTPIAAGTILFESESGPPHVAEGAMIEAGRFRIPAATGLLPGKYRVSVSATDGTPTAAEAGGGNGMLKELVPAKYNAKTTLTADVTDAGPNDLSFPLEKP